VRTVALAAAVALIMTAGGCTSKTLEIESDTNWSGAVGSTGSRTIDGRGNRSFDIDPSGIVCWDFQKQSEAGRLRAYAKIHTLVSADRDGDETTTAAFGVVTGCTQ